MTLSKIKVANKKSRHEARRRQKQREEKLKRQGIIIRNKRARKMIIQGRKEHLAQRRREMDYVKDMENQLNA